MPVETKAPHLAAKAQQWARVRDAVGGSDAVRGNAPVYIPQLSGQTSTEYASYISRPVFFEATGRTRDAMTGLVFARAPTVDIPAALEALIDDIDADGSGLDDFAAHMVDELQETGFGALVVMHNGDPDNPGTADNPTGRPYLTWYPAESVIDYRHDVVAGARILTQLRVMEVATEPSGEFDVVEVPEIVVHDLEEGERYRIRRYRKRDTDKARKQAPEWVQFGPAQYAFANGASLGYVPARIVTANGRRTPGNAPLAALAEMNLSHWRTSADYEHALHFCGLPTPYVTGVSAPTRPRGDVIEALEDASLPTVRRASKPATIKLGSTTMQVFENPQAQMRYLTLPVEGIGALEKALLSKAGSMAVLGARMLAQEGGPAESGVALTVKRSGESSALVRIARSVSAAITEALNICAEWVGIKDECTYEVDTSFATAAMDAPTITALLAAVNAGKLSVRSFLEKMKAAGFVADARSVDDEKEEIANDPAPVDPLSAFGNFGDDPTDDTPTEEPPVKVPEPA